MSGVVPAAAVTAATAAVTASASRSVTAAAAAAVTAAAAATAAITAAAGASAAGASAAAVTAAAAAFFAGTSFVDGQRSTAERGAVESLDGRRRLVVVDHFHEAEAATPTAEFVDDDLAARDLAVLLKQLDQVFAGRVVGQVAHIDIFRHDSRPCPFIRRLRNGIVAGDSERVPSRPPAVGRERLRDARLVPNVI